MIPFDDEADALRIANGTVYSLAAGVWSADIGRVHRMAAELRAGTVWVNTYGYTDVRLPWGGSGDSGFGREHGDVAIQNFTEPKSAVGVAHALESEAVATEKGGREIPAALFVPRARAQACAVFS